MSKYTYVQRMAAVSKGLGHLHDSIRCLEKSSVAGVETLDDKLHVIIQASIILELYRGARLGAEPGSAKWELLRNVLYFPTFKLLEDPNGVFKVNGIEFLSYVFQSSREKHRGSPISNGNVAESVDVDQFIVESLYIHLRRLAMPNEFWQELCGLEQERQMAFALQKSLVAEERVPIDCKEIARCILAIPTPIVDEQLDERGGREFCFKKKKMPILDRFRYSATALSDLVMVSPLLIELKRRVIEFERERETFNSEWWSGEFKEKMNAGLKCVSRYEDLSELYPLAQYIFKIGRDSAVIDQVIKRLWPSEDAIKVRDSHRAAMKEIEKVTFVEKGNAQKWLELYLGALREELLNGAAPHKSLAYQLLFVVVVPASVCGPPLDPVNATVFEWVMFLLTLVALGNVSDQGKEIVLACIIRRGFNNAGVGYLLEVASQLRMPRDGYLEEDRKKFVGMLSGVDWIGLVCVFSQDASSVSQDPWSIDYRAEDWAAKLSNSMKQMQFSSTCGGVVVTMQQVERLRKLLLGWRFNILALHAQVFLECEKREYLDALLQSVKEWKIRRVFVIYVISCSSEDTSLFKFRPELEKMGVTVDRVLVPANVDIPKSSKEFVEFLEKYSTQDYDE